VIEWTWESGRASPGEAGASFSCSTAPSLMRSASPAHENNQGHGLWWWGSKDSMSGIWVLAPIESTSQIEGIWGEESRGRREKTCNLYVPIGI
jgi:hypothetical protein